MDQPPIWRHRLSRDAGVSTLALGGELDLACAPTVQALLVEELQSALVTDVRVDLAEVDFLDSTALGVLVSGLQHAQMEGRGFTVVNPSAVARRILTMTGLDQVLLPS